MVDQTIECKSEDPTGQVILNNNLSNNNNNDNDNIRLDACETMVSKCWFFWK